MASGSAFAADMPLKAPMPVALYDWSGFYIGGGWSHEKILAANRLGFRRRAQN